MNLFLLLLLFLPAVASAESLGGDSPVILFLGDSLTAGYGLSEDEAYPALIQQKIDAAGLRYSVRNAGISGDTTAGGLSRLSWALRAKPAIFVLALGANDGLRGVSPEETKKNLIEIIHRVREHNKETKIVLCGIDLPTNLGSEFRETFKAVFPAVAKESEVVLVPFLLEGVAGKKEYNLADGIHPTADGQRLIAETVWRVINPLLR